MRGFPQPRNRLARLILRQFRGIFNLLLLAAAAITFALGEPIDGCFILFFVFLGTGLNVYQEYKSNAAADKLKSYLRHTITVWRDGREQEVVTEDLVPGDTLSLELGDIVPADATVRESRDLFVGETTFTGESIPVSKRAASAERGVGYGTGHSWDRQRTVPRLSGGRRSACRRVPDDLLVRRSAPQSPDAAAAGGSAASAASACGADPLFLRPW